MCLLFRAPWRQRLWRAARPSSTCFEGVWSSWTEIQGGPDALDDLIIHGSIQLPTHLSLFSLSLPATGPMVAHLLSWLHFLSHLRVCKESRFLVGVQTQRSWLRSQTGCRQAPRLPLLANLRNGLSDPVTARRGGEVARGAPALCQRRVRVANGLFNFSSTSTGRL